MRCARAALVSESTTPSSWAIRSPTAGGGMKRRSSHSRGLPPASPYDFSRSLRSRTGSTPNSSATSSATRRQRRRSEENSSTSAPGEIWARGARAMETAARTPAGVSRESCQPPTILSTWCVASGCVTTYRVRTDCLPPVGGVWSRAGRSCPRVAQPVDGHAELEPGGIFRRCGVNGRQIVRIPVAVTVGEDEVLVHLAAGRNLRRGVEELRDRRRRGRGRVEVA